MSITLAIIILTCLVSISAFNREKLIDDLIFYPPAITQRKQYYRFFTCGLIHADFIHLLFNMYGLYIFGTAVENMFAEIFNEKGKVLYLLMYISALFFSLLPTYSKHKNDSYYRSLGASGAVTAVIFAFIFLDPLRKMGLLFLPSNFMIPGFIFGLIYIILSSYFEKRGQGNINHSAHIWGGIYGIVFLILTGYVFSEYKVLHEFIAKVQLYFTTF
jgi:membrane associated rhomboid family serine protease